MAYVYGGTIRDAATPLPAPTRPQNPDSFDPSACGTYAGYARHRKHNIPACQDCKDAMATYSRDRYQPKKPRGFRADACGTWAGWHRHRYHGVPICERCKAAAREFQRKSREAKRSAERSSTT